MSASEFTLSLADILARIIDSFRINDVEANKNFVLKRRRRGRGWVIFAGNIFLWLSHSRIVMFPSTRAWQSHECQSFNLLHGMGCDPIGGDSIRVRRLKGQPLLTHLGNGRLTVEMLYAAAEEFQRAHRLGWSHGDPHLNNVLWDGERAYLIDFETRHIQRLSIIERRADDLLVFLLDLSGRAPENQWNLLCEAVLSAYQDRVVMAALLERLRMPRGWEAILWKSRTNHLSAPILASRIDQLRRLVEVQINQNEN